MALWRATRGRAFERRREQEARSRLQWESYSRSFARAAICCSAQARWSAPRGPRSPSSGRREAAERLGQRRERLRELLSAERDALEAELQPGRGTEPAGMRERCAELRAAREGRRRQVSAAGGGALWPRPPTLLSALRSPSSCCASTGSRTALSSGRCAVSG